METIAYNIILNVRSVAMQETGIVLTQGDGMHHAFHIYVKNGSDNFMPTGNVSVEISFRRKDGFSVVGSAYVDGDHYTYKLIGNELAVPGKVIADCKFSEGSGRISTRKFCFTVESDTTDQNSIAAEVYISALEQLKTEALALIAQMNAAIEEGVASSLMQRVGNLEGEMQQKLNASQVLTEEEWNAGTVSQRGYLADAKDVLDEFAQLNTDIGNRIRCIRDTPQLANVPAGYSEQSVSLSNISGTVVGTAVRVTSYASGGGYLCVTLNGSNAWIEAEKAQKSINLEILRFYTN